MPYQTHGERMPNEPFHSPLAAGAATSLAVRDLTLRSALLALDEIGHSPGAIALAAWLARRRGTSITVVSAVDQAGAPAQSGPITSRIDRCVSRRHAVRESLYGTTEARGWPVEIVTGAPVVRIVEVAHTTNVDLVIMGTHRDRVGARSIHDDTVRRVTRRIDRPVIAVADRQRVPPRIAVAALDFSRSSLEAARGAATLLDTGGVLWLVHVRPPFERADNLLRNTYALGMADALDRAMTDVGRAGDVDVRGIILEGDAVAELGQYVRQVDADLVALGSSRPPDSRAMIGRLTSSLIREGTRSVLIAPPPARVLHPKAAPD
jgi:nucleotide-binding universal stress UspA family protein